MGDKKEFEAKDEKQIIACRAVNPRAYISIEECKKCGHHKGIQDHAELNGKKYYAVICGLPTAIRIDNLISIGGEHGIHV